MASIQFPNESAEYRTARRALLEAEASLRSEVERVARLRRELPLGGTVPEDYEFTEWRDGGAAPVKLSELFGDGTDTLFIYGLMYAPAAEKACPLCTSFLDSLDGNVVHIEQRLSVAVVARSPIERIREHAQTRGWSRLRLLSAANNDYPRHYLTESDKGQALPMGHVFVRREGKIHHHWGSELLFEPSEEGDSRHIDMMWPLWNVLDLTPEGRGQHYPKLTY